MEKTFNEIKSEYKNYMDSPKTIYTHNANMLDHKGRPICTISRSKSDMNQLPHTEWKLEKKLSHKFSVYQTDRFRTRILVRFKLDYMGNHYMEIVDRPGLTTVEKCREYIKSNEYYFRKDAEADFAEFASQRRGY